MEDAVKAFEEVLNSSVGFAEVESGTEPWAHWTNHISNTLYEV
jgi:hypothetical protein